MRNATVPTAAAIGAGMLAIVALLVVQQAPPPHISTDTLAHLVGTGTTPNRYCLFIIVDVWESDCACQGSPTAVQGCEKAYQDPNRYSCAPASFVSCESPIADCGLKQDCLPNCSAAWRTCDTTFYNCAKSYKCQTVAN